MTIARTSRDSGIPSSREWDAGFEVKCGEMGFEEGVQGHLGEVLDDLFWFCGPEVVI